MANSRGEEVGACVRTLFEVGAVGDLGDAELLERFATRAGEAADAAFSVLVERHGPMVLRVCRSVLGDPHDANDAFQATFLVAARRARSIRVGESLAPWLFRVAHRTALRARRAEARRRKHEARAAERAVLHVVDARPDDLDTAIHEEIDRLPGNDRAAVVLCVLEGLTHQQAAQRLRWPVGTVESRLARARTRLRRSLTRRGLAPSAGLLAAGSLLGRTASAAVPPSLFQSTVQAAAQFSAGGWTAVATAPSAVALAKGVLRRTFLATIAPALAVSLLAGGLALGTALGRATIGSKPPKPPGRPTSAPAPIIENPAPATTPPRIEQEARFGVSRGDSGLVVPEPYRAVVRLRARIDGAERLATGVVVWSTRDEALIVANAQVLDFRPERDGPTFERKPSSVTVNLLAPPAGDTPPKMLLMFEDTAYVGEPVSYDLQRSVALIRIRTGGRLLPVSPIVPTRWRPEVEMQMLDIGCSEHAPVRWPATITNPMVRGMAGNGSFEGLECRFDLKTGGALFTTDGFLAGVGCFGDHRAVHTIYAAPQSIQRLLDGAGLSHLYGKEGHAPPLGTERAREVLSQDLSGELGAQASQPPGVGRESKTPPKSDAEPDTPGDQSESDRIGRLERRVDAMDRKLDRILEKLGGGTGR